MAASSTVGTWLCLKNGGCLKNEGFASKVKRWEPRVVSSFEFCYSAYSLSKDLDDQGMAWELTSWRMARASDAVRGSGDA
jgi:hypothetical protein